MNKRSILTYTVWSLDVWGHAPEECAHDLGCPCVTREGDDEPVHDDDACDAGFSVNDRCRVGTLTIETDEGVTWNVAPEHRAHAFESWGVSDAAMVRALIEANYLAPHVTSGDLEIEGEDESIFIEESRDGRPLLQLDLESEEVL